MLDARKKAILYVAVQEYILTAEPVSSQRLVEKYQLGVSSATVRNELAHLEELGYLYQPHTSAGRLPTDAGYRYYVDCTSNKPGLTGSEEKTIRDLYSVINKEIEGLLQETTRVLSDFTKQVSVVLAPAFNKSRIKHVDIVSLNSKYSLIVLITDRGQVIKRSLGIELPVEEAQTIERILNDQLQGKSVLQIELLKEDKSLEKLPNLKVVRIILDEIIEMLKAEDRERVILSGTQCIFDKPEFENIGKVQSLLDSLEHGYRLLQLLEESMLSEKVLVRIGKENEDEQISDCSVIASSYQIDGEALGTVGIIGPTRMNYARAISAVEFIAENLSKALRELRA